MIELKNISKSYDSKTVLGPLNLNFAAQKTHVIIGSSGSGKSTLLRIIMGLISADSGEVLVNGERVQATRRQKLLSTIGYVIQEGGLFPHLSAGSNITLRARQLNWSRQRIRERLDELCELVALDVSLLRKFPHQLSGGQRQRIALMRALVLDPDIVLLDEPLGALDPIIRADLQRELRRIFDQLKKTVMLVTHDMGEAAFFGDTITLLEKGAVVQHGSYKEFTSRPESSFVTTFINAQRTLADAEAV